MLVDLVLHDAKIYNHGRLIEAGIAIDEGRIFKIAKETNLPQASMKLNLKGGVALPGIIDCHVHLRDQQLAYREDFLTGTMAAAAGGVTLTMDMPNNKPVTMNALSLRERMKLAEKRVFVNVAFYSAFPNNLEEIPKIVEEGALAFKLFLSNRIGGLNTEDDSELLRAFDKVKETGVLIAVHAEDKDTIENGVRKMKGMGKEDVGAYLEAHSPEAEARAIQRITSLIRESNVPIHFCHISSAAGLQALLKARDTELPITCEVTPHHLLLTQGHLKTYGAAALTVPPFRTESDIKALWNALSRGLIDVLASDHAPHAIECKKVESIWEVKPGIPGLETILPLMLTNVNEGRLALSDLVRLASEKPAEIFNLRGRGDLSEGYHADITVVDMSQEYAIDATKFYSKAKYSPFDGWRVKGKPIMTFVNGQLVYDSDEIVAKPGVGRIIRR